MKFWDASAVVPLLVREEATAALEPLYRRDPHLCVCWTTVLECVSAVARREREGVLTLAGAEAALGRLRTLSDRWEEILPADGVRADALRLLRVHPLRALGAFQLASARLLCRGRPDRYPFVCCDRLLSDAATREGFTVVDPLSPPA